MKLAYRSNDEKRLTEVLARIAAEEEKIKDNNRALKFMAHRDPAAVELRHENTQRQQNIAELRSVTPVLLFWEEGALRDLEAQFTKDDEKWEMDRATWQAHTFASPRYAIEIAGDIIASEVRHDAAVTLANTWLELSEKEGRTLATFRKALNYVTMHLRRTMMQKLTGGTSTSALSNAVDHATGCAIDNLLTMSWRYLIMLEGYEIDVQTMKPFIQSNQVSA